MPISLGHDVLISFRNAKIHLVNALNIKRLVKETQFINDSVELPNASIWTSFIIYFTA